MAATELPSVMKAWQYSSTKGGVAKNLKLNASAPFPKPKADFHVVRIVAAALNPVDYKPAEIPGMSLAISKPATPGIDFSGIMVKPAPGSSLKVGQRVFGVAGSSPFAGGALAEYAVAGVKGVAALPDGVEYMDGVTAGVAAVTAYQSMQPHVKEGSRIFINGGSGGTGVFGIQIAKILGCHVTTTCSTPNVDLCRSLGADKVIDYKTENVLETLNADTDKFDCAIDNVGSSHELTFHCHEFLRPGSVYVTVGGDASLNGLSLNLKRKFLPAFLGGVKAKVTGFWPSQNTVDLDQLAKWMQEGKLKAVRDQVFPFDQAPQAIERSKTGRARGKVVISVAPEQAK